MIDTTIDTQIEYHHAGPGAATDRGRPRPLRSTTAPVRCADRGGLEPRSPTRPGSATWEGTVTGDLRAGGQYELEGNAHGAILDCRRPHHLAVIWDSTGPDRARRPAGRGARRRHAPRARACGGHPGRVRGGRRPVRIELGARDVPPRRVPSRHPPARGARLGGRREPDARRRRSDRSIGGSWGEIARSQGYASPGMTRVARTGPFWTSASIRSRPSSPAASRNAGRQPKGEQI